VIRVPEWSNEEGSSPGSCLLTKDRGGGPPGFLLRHPSRKAIWSLACSQTVTLFREGVARLLGRGSRRTCKRLLHSALRPSPPRERNRDRLATDLDDLAVGGPPAFEARHEVRRPTSRDARNRPTRPRLRQPARRLVAQANPGRADVQVELLAVLPGWRGRSRAASPLAAELVGHRGVRARRRRPRPPPRQDRPGPLSTTSNVAPRQLDNRSVSGGEAVSFQLPPARPSRRAESAVGQVSLDLPSCDARGAGQAP